MTINAVSKGIRAEFYRLLETQATKTLDPIAEVVKSLSNTENYFVPQDVPGFNELLDEVKFDEIGDYKISIDNKDYYGSVREDRNRIEDSKEYLSANIENQLRGITKSWMNSNTKLIGELLNYGDTTTKGVSFDGQNFFSTSKSIDTGDNTIVNLTTSNSTGTLTVTTAELDYATAKSLLYGFKSKSNEPFNANPDLAVICVPEHEDIFTKLLSERSEVLATTGGAAKSNIYAGNAKVIVNWAATTDKSWYLVNMAANVKPFIVQERQEPEFYFDDDNKKKYVDFYYKARKGAGYGNPMAIIKIKTT